MNGVEGLRLPTDVVVSPDGRHVVVAGTGASSVVVFERDASTGGLDFVGRTVMAELDFVSGLAFSPDGEHLYAAAVGPDQVSVFERDASTGGLTFVQVLTDGEDGVEGLEGVRQVEVSPDGGEVYAASFLDNALAVFSRDGISGELTFVEVHVDGVAGVSGLQGPAGIDLSRDGQFLYVASSTGDAIATFARAPDGRLTFVEAFTAAGTLDFMTDFAVSPNGSYAVAVSQVLIEGGDWIALFARDPVGGTLTLLEEIGNPPLANGCQGGPIDPLARVNYVADDRLYVTAAAHQGVAALRFDEVDERLAVVQIACDGIDGVAGTSSAADVEPSPDGVHLYSSGFFPNTLGVFRIDAMFSDGFESGDTSAWSE